MSGRQINHRKKNSVKKLLNSEKESYSFLIKEEIILEMTS